MKAIIAIFLILGLSQAISYSTIRSFGTGAAYSCAKGNGLPESVAQMAKRGVGFAMDKAKWLFDKIFHRRLAVRRRAWGIFSAIRSAASKLCGSGISAGCNAAWKAVSGAFASVGVPTMITNCFKPKLTTECMSLGKKVLHCRRQ